jgi:transcriptional regulator with XRE-family HTH domain
MRRLSDAAGCGERLKVLRERHGMSLSTLGTICGVSKQAVYLWEKGQCFPSRENLQAIARYFGLRLRWLISGTGPTFPPVIKPSFDANGLLSKITLRRLEARGLELSRELEMTRVNKE